MSEAEAALFTRYFLWLLGVVGIWGVIIITTVRWVIGRSLNAFDSRFEKVEAEIKDMQKTLPLEYVRREDFIPFQVRLSAKMDALAALLYEQKGRNKTKETGI